MFTIGASIVIDPQLSREYCFNFYVFISVLYNYIKNYIYIYILKLISHMNGTHINYLSPHIFGSQTWLAGKCPIYRLTPQLNAHLVQGFPSLQNEQIQHIMHPRCHV